MPLKDTAYKKSGLAGIRTRDLPAYSDDGYAEAGALTTRPQAQLRSRNTAASHSDILNMKTQSVMKNNLSAGFLRGIAPGAR